MATRGKGPFAKRRLLLLTLALVPLLFPAPADIPFEWTGVDRVVAVADLHGDYERFVFILTHPQIDLVDADLHWKGGQAHLVQLGDILDRGTRAKDILDLLMRLEKEAAAAGGMVHTLLGNHEEMNITGIALDYPGYVTVGQFLSFLPDDFRRERDEQYFKTLRPEDQILADIDGLDAAVNEGYAAFWRKIIASKNADAARAYVTGFNAVYGAWLARQNTVIKINDVIYVHGGISEALSKWPMREINQVMRSELEFFQGRMRNPRDFGTPFHPRLVYDPDSPLWFRGLATKDEKDGPGRGRTDPGQPRGPGHGHRAQLLPLPRRRQPDHRAEERLPFPGQGLDHGHGHLRQLRRHPVGPPLRPRPIHGLGRDRGAGRPQRHPRRPRRSPSRPGRWRPSSGRPP